MGDQAPQTTAAHHPRPPGRRAVRVGATMLVGSLVLIGLCLAYGLHFATWAGDAEVFEMPGSVTKELEEGSAAVYTEVHGGVQIAPPERDYTVTGPGEVDVIVYGFFSDPSQIRVDGTVYELAAKLEVPQDGTYEVTVADDEYREPTTAVLGRYTGSHNWRFLMILAANFFGLVGVAGLVVLLVGLVRRRRGRRTAAPAG